MSTLTTTVTGKTITVACVVNRVDGASGGWQGDWAAYSAPGSWSVEETGRRGDKLPEAMARALFPGIDLDYRP